MDSACSTKGRLSTDYTPNFGTSKGEDPTQAMAQQLVLIPSPRTRVVTPSSISSRRITGGVQLWERMAIYIFGL